MPESIKAVLFDLDNTLVSYYQPEDFAPVLREAIVGISGELQRRGFPQDRNRLLERAWEFNHERDDHRVWPLTDRLREIFGPPASDPALMPQMAALFLRPIFRCARLDPAAVATLEEFRRRGIRTGIVSNTPWGSAGGSWRGDLERLGLARAADVTVFSTDVGWRKPAPAIFERALMQLGVTASQTSLLGDEWAADIQGAKRMGMKPILFDPKLKHEGEPELLRIRKIPEILDLIASGDSFPA